MDKVIAVRPDDLDCTLQPGVNWMQLNEVLKQDKLFFPVDPGPTAKIGGMVGTNCSGTNAYRYGPMRDYIINMTVVLADGSIIKTRRRPRKSSAGYNLNHLFCGSEGTLGLITEVTVKLEVLPEMSRVAICSFPTIRDATDTAASLVKAGIKVGALELMDDVQMKAVNDSGLTTRKWDVMPTLFFKFSGTSPSVKEQADKAQDIAKLNNSRNFVFARSDKESDELWSARKQLLWTMMAVGPEDSIFYSTDVAVPLSRLAEMVEQSKKDILDSGIFGSCLGHVGDGNFHSCILYREEESGKFIALKKKIIERGLAMEGTCTGEHGIGASKVKELGMELGSETLSLMRTIKLAVDPHELMNPGKIFTKESIEHTIQNERINGTQNSNTL
jgi:D-lactate dehydrogenase (cytochrome)